MAGQANGWHVANQVTGGTRGGLPDLPRVLPAEPIATLDEFLERGGHDALQRAQRARSGRDDRRARPRRSARTRWRRVSRPAASGARCATPRDRGTTSSSTARKENRERSRIARSCAAIRTRSSPAPRSRAFTVDAHDVYIGVKASFGREFDAIERATRELADAGLLGDLDVTIARGPDEYLFGEEKALLEVIEGNDPLPRVLPPFQHGLFATAPQLGWTATEAEPGEARGDRANPTLVNNVETLAQVTWILAHGADEFRAAGTDRSPGHDRVHAVRRRRGAGRVRAPARNSAARARSRGTRAAPRPGRPVKMVCSGVANAVLSADRLDTPADFESLAVAGAGLGSAGFIVYDDETCALAVARLFSRFLYVESCGQCPPCKLQSGEITDALERIERDGDAAQLGRIQRALETVTDGNRCYLAVEEQQVVSSVLRQFPEDIVAHEEGRCRLRHDLVLPKLVDFDGTQFVYDERQARKRPDWTYS